MEWLTDPRFILGMVVFFTGMAINWHSDAILINLRKPGETGYKIPMGGLFRWVSCPNLLGEVIEWVGFGILTWSLPGLVFAIWTFANVVPRAISHHRWYKEKFPEYPKDRKAVIPGIW
jgi:steroid 5-alpha reductase family enzyme